MQQPKKGRMLYADCELADCSKGRCAIEGCNARVRTGCKAHGIRLCWPKCLQLHLTGGGKIAVDKGSTSKRKAVEWK